MEIRKLAMAAVALTLAALATESSAAPQNRSTPGCFFVRDIGDRTVGGPHTLYFKVKDQAHMHAIAYYRIETRDACNTGPTSNDEHHAYTIASTQVAAGRAAMICRAEDLQIVEPPGCIPTSIHRMTPGEVDALPHGIKP